jgi:hypothetical protein
MTTTCAPSSCQPLSNDQRGDAIERGSGLFGGDKRPQKVGTDPSGKTCAVYEMETDGCGYIIGSIEYQGRGLVHAHLAVRPASLSVRRRQPYATHRRALACCAQRDCHPFHPRRPLMPSPARLT